MTLNDKRTQCKFCVKKIIIVLKKIYECDNFSIGLANSDILFSKIGMLKEGIIG